MEEIMLFGKIPIYGVCYYLGILVSVVLGLFFAKKQKVHLFDFACCGIYTMIGAIIGAKSLFILVSIRKIIELQLGFIEIMKGGFVFYGGLLGGAFGAWLFGKQFHLPVKGYLDIFALVLPLGHAIGRIGCFFAGCCYGIEYEGACSVVYSSSNTAFTPLGVPLLPIQLIESACLLCVFAVLLFLYCRKERKEGVIACVYLLAYGVLRFIMEFFRGDKERGVLLFSTSQWISIGIIIAVLVMMWLKRRKREIES